MKCKNNHPDCGTVTPKDAKFLKEMNKRSYADTCLERAEKATEGPWVSVKAYDKPKVRYFVAECTNKYAGRGIADLDGTCRKESDAEFIAHAREDVPELARRLQKAIEIIRWVDDSDGEYDFIIYRGLTLKQLADELEKPLGDV